MREKKNDEDSIYLSKNQKKKLIIEILCPDEFVLTRTRSFVFFS